MSRSEEQSARCGKVAFYFIREAGRRRAVDQAVIIADRKGHHQARDELVVVHLRHKAAAADQQDRDLRRVDDRRRVDAAHGTEITDGERTAFQEIKVELAFADRASQLFDLRGNLGDALAIGIAKDRYHQTTLRVDRDADVYVLLVD